MQIIVIGGGDVAMDAARVSARRKGVEEVTLICLERRNEMPASPEEISASIREGIIIKDGWGLSTAKLVEGEMMLTFERCVSVFDDSGRFAPRFDKSETLSLTTDFIVTAIGQEPEKILIGSIKGLSLSGGAVAVGEDFSTGVPGIFALGDAAHRPALIIDAVADGKRAARSVFEYLEGKKLKLDSRWSFNSHGRAMAYHTRPLDFDSVPAADHEAVGSGRSDEAARAETERCLNCAVNTIFDADRCVLCGGCVDVCPMKCLRIVPLSDIDSQDTEIIGALMEADGEPGESCGRAIIKDEETCIRCALCARRCPADAISMEELSFEESYVLE